MKTVIDVNGKRRAIEYEYHCDYTPMCSANCPYYSFLECLLFPPDTSPIQAYIARRRRPACKRAEQETRRK